MNRTEIYRKEMFRVGDQNVRVTYYCEQEREAGYSVKIQVRKGLDDNTCLDVILEFKESLRADLFFSRIARNPQMLLAIIRKKHQAYYYNKQKSQEVEIKERICTIFHLNLN